jgi:hypothetical protein
MRNTGSLRILTLTVNLILCHGDGGIMFLRKFDNYQTTWPYIRQYRNITVTAVRTSDLGYHIITHFNDKFSCTMHTKHKMRTKPSLVI